MEDKEHSDVVEEFELCLVGNIIDKHYFGESKEIRRGNKQFRPGAKVLCFPVYGGMADVGNVFVVGRPRHQLRHIRIIINMRMIKNVRVKKIYEPYLVNIIKEDEFYSRLKNDPEKMEILADWAEKINSGHIEIEE